ncbi:MAG: ATP-dependent protease ATPase subunit HslU [Leptospiraceae bacterium]|nr:ATP-dependent protease ATPase subunit HslU [Leptospiraceae bacterium]
MVNGLTPAEIVAKLDEFIIGQKDAKKAVAIALRNRSRRQSLGEDPLREEIHPKNIILIGPTGVGKTEIARRLAKLANAPFIKVEATKFTEVGYVGRDVESMVRDLAMIAMKMVRERHEEKNLEAAEKKVEERILDILVSGADSTEKSVDDDEAMVRDIFRKKLKAGSLEDREIEIRAQATSSGPVMQVMAMPGMEEIENQMQNMLGDIFPKKKESRKLAIKDARKLLLSEELENLLDMEKIKAEAVDLAEQNGIIFIDEIDKIASRGSKGSPDVSREGVQRDILPLVEGSTVNTRIGQIKTDHILFIAAGAFHISAVSDLIPELQGRFPIRVELTALALEDYVEILQNPRNALSKQYQALLSTEGVSLAFTESGFEAIAEIALDMNMRQENIGARRLHTIMEKMLEDVSFRAQDFKDNEVTIDAAFVKEQLGKIISDSNLSRFIL